MDLEARMVAAELRDKIEKLTVLVEGLSYNRRDDELKRLRQALRTLADAAGPFIADQSKATDERVGLVQPVTVKEAEKLNAAYREAREVLDEI